MPNEQNPNPAEAAPVDRSIFRTICNILATRSEMARLELAIARDNVQKTILFGVVGAFFAVLAIIFVSIAFLAIFWEDHRILASCALAAFYVILTLFFFGRARNLAANMPYAFTMTSQVLKEDLLALAGVQTAAQDGTQAAQASAPAAANASDDATQPNTHAATENPEKTAPHTAVTRQFEDKIRDLQARIDKGN